MDQIDLKDYAYQNSKISSKDLIHKGQSNVEVKWWMVLAANLIDLSLISIFISLITKATILFITSFLPSKELTYALHSINTLGLLIGALPLVLTSYYFTFNFLNHGQSIGMMMLKIRIDLIHYSFKRSFTWACYSTLSILTFGISYLITKNSLQNLFNGRFKIQDFLIHELMEDKVVYPINLSDEDLVTKTKNTEGISDFKQAA